MCIDSVENHNFTRLFKNGEHIADVYAKDYAPLFIFAEEFIEETRTNCERKLIDGT